MEVRTILDEIAKHRAVKQLKPDTVTQDPFFKDLLPQEPNHKVGRPPIKQMPVVNRSLDDRLKQISQPEYRSPITAGQKTQRRLEMEQPKGGGGGGGTKIEEPTFEEIHGMGPEEYLANLADGEMVRAMLDAQSFDVWQQENVSSLLALVDSGHYGNQEKVTKAFQESYVRQVRDFYEGGMSDWIEKLKEEGWYDEQIIQKLVQVSEPILQSVGKLDNELYNKIVKHYGLKDQLSKLLEEAEKAFTDARGLDKDEIAIEEAKKEYDRLKGLMKAFEEGDFGAIKGDGDPEMMNYFMRGVKEGGDEGARSPRTDMMEETEGVFGSGYGTSTSGAGNPGAKLLAMAQDKWGQEGETPREMFARMFTRAGQKIGEAFKRDTAEAAEVNIQQPDEPMTIIKKAGERAVNPFDNIINRRDDEEYDAFGFPIRRSSGQGRGGVFSRGGGGGSGGGGRGAFR